MEKFQSTHPARGATLTADPNRILHFFISIHAPREGCDRHALRFSRSLSRFQSTHPARGATTRGLSFCSIKPDFNPRTPRGVRQRPPSWTTRVYNFNPRTPRGVRLTWIMLKIAIAIFQSTHPARGATRYTVKKAPLVGKFQSTHPARGATPMRLIARRPLISIHAPREGCDSTMKIVRFYRVRQAHFREGQKCLSNHREKSPISLL